MVNPCAYENVCSQRLESIKSVDNVDVRDIYESGVLYEHIIIHMNAYECIWMQMNVYEWGDFVNEKRILMY